MTDMPVMDFRLYLTALVMLIPISSAGTCMTLTAFSRGNCLTRLEQAERFSPWHYFVPVLLGAVFLVWSLLVPFDAQVEIVRSRQLSVTGEYEAYSRFFTTKPLLRMIFILVYYGFIARLLVRYYRRASVRSCGY
ncbi:hypothetical protein FACS1894182_03460 [Bacteroidia bacterium]|nr:hypothetical protein FACS1894182_03460 [Bacteroidia bacterium]